MTDKLSPQQRSENMRRIRAKDTSPEIAVRQIAHRMGFRYRLHVASLPGKPDLVFPRLKKIIEVRGCFWHQHKECIDSHVPKTDVQYWGTKLKGNTERDRRNERALRAAGWEILTIWECQVRKLKNIERSMRRFLAGRRSASGESSVKGSSRSSR